MSTPENANEECVGPQSEKAGLASSCAGCPNAKACASGAGREADPDLSIISERMSHIKKKVLVLSGKGGVGKSTLTKELGIIIGRRGLQVGLMDTDICGPSMPRITGALQGEIHQSGSGWEPVSVDENVGLVSVQFLLQDADSAVIFRGPRKNGVIKNFIKDVAWGPLDLLLVDTPPGTSDEHLSCVDYLKQSGGCDGAIIITTPQEVAMADVRRELNFCKKANVKVLGIVENMSGFICPGCKGESQIFPPKKGAILSAGRRLSEEFAVPFLGAIPLDPSLMMSCDVGEPLSDHLQANAMEAAEKAGKPLEEPPVVESAAVTALEKVATSLLTILN